MDSSTGLLRLRGEERRKSRRLRHALSSDIGSCVGEKPMERFNPVNDPDVPSTPFHYIPMRPPPPGRHGKPDSRRTLRDESDRTSWTLAVFDGERAPSRRVIFQQLSHLLLSLTLSLSSTIAKKKKRKTEFHQKLRALSTMHVKPSVVLALLSTLPAP